MELLPNYNNIINSGGYGDIYKCIGNNNIVAKLTSNNCSESNKKIINKLNHKNILRIYNIDKKKYKGISIIYMEYINGITLDEYFKTNININNINNIIIQILNGLTFLHKNNITHRDLKLNNILYSNNIIKIVDFGLSYYGLPCKGLVGTSGYFAPEMIYSLNSYDNRCDIWSLGCIIYCIICNYVPFYNDYNKDDYIKQIKEEYEIKYDDEKWKNNLNLKNLCEKMLVYNYKNRYTSFQCLNDLELFIT